MYKLSKRSLDKLEGLDPRLVAVVKSAIHRTKIDFGVICGMRTMEEQKALVASGASQTMKSKHLGLCRRLNGVYWLKGLLGIESL